MPMTREEANAYMRAYNQRPGKLERKRENARIRYQYLKNKPEYRERLLKNNLTYFANTLIKHGYTVIPPKEIEK